VSSAPRRAQCPRCLRPQTACICALAQPLQAATQVLVLQHPLELQEAKGTARLLHLCLPGSRLEVGEAFDPAQLEQWLYGAWPGAEAPQQTLLLYPQTPDQPAALAALTDRDAPAPVRRLVLIDGTWRKSRKMLYANPLLARLPRLALTDTAPAGYRIRKAPRAGQLSTLEAAALALQQLEAWPDGAPPLQALQQSFDGLIAQYERLRSAH